MNNPTLGEPSPRISPLSHKRAQWDIELEELLSIPQHVNISFERAVERRKSTRRFALLGRRELSTLLWMSAGTRSVNARDQEQEHRPTPSAGALHPIHMIVIPPIEPRVARYDGRRHALLWLKCDSASVQAVRDEAERFMQTGLANILLFAAEPQITCARYEHAESLVWRDAGMLQAQCGLVASALGLAYCLLGTTGQSWISRLFGSQEGLLGTGAALVGAMESIAD